MVWAKILSSRGVTVHKHDKKTKHKIIGGEN